MIKLFFVIYFQIVVFFLQTGSAFASHFVTQSTVKCRPLAMGGAFTAVNDNLAAFSYNPATFSQYQFIEDFRLTFYVSPLASAISLVQQDKPDDLQELGKSLAFLVKSVTFSTRYLEGGIFLSEESVQNYPLNTRKKLFSAEGFWESYSHKLGLRLALAQQVAIGLATTFYYNQTSEGGQWKIGNSYGVLLKPDRKYAVGVFYIALPSDLKESRIDLERLFNDTVNIGVAYYPSEKTTLALDIRNINDENMDNSREIHIGAEQLLGNLFALRAGYFREQPQTHIISGGVGFLADNFLFKKNKKFLPPKFIFNYSMVLERENTLNSMWHFFSLVLRF